MLIVNMTKSSFATQVWLLEIDDGCNIAHSAILRLLMIF